MGAAIAGGLLVWSLALRPSTEITSRGRYALELAPGTSVMLGQSPSISVSPDGSRVVYRANGVDGVRGRYVREMDAFEPTLIAGTENAVSPFFSPNGEWIGFFDLQASELRKVSLGGGAPTTVCGTGRFPRGGTWGDDDTIFLNFGYYLGIHRVAASGGVPELLTVPNLDEGEKTHRFPEILPGGKALLFTVGTSEMTSFDQSRIAVLDLETGTIDVLVEGGSMPRYLETGHIIYGRNGSLMAVPFDADRLELRGVPKQVLDGVVTSHSFGAAQFTVSRNGTLVYTPGGPELYDTTVSVIERNGGRKPLPLQPGSLIPCSSQGRTDGAQRPARRAR